MTDEELVATELAELAHYTGQQARAEAALLRMLPIEWAASTLREATLDALSGQGQWSANPWIRYLRLEAQVIQLRRIAEPWPPVTSLWSELDIGDEPEPLRFFRRHGWDSDGRPRF